MRYLDVWLGFAVVRERGWVCVGGVMELEMNDVEEMWEKNI